MQQFENLRQEVVLASQAGAVVLLLADVPDPEVARARLLSREMSAWLAASTSLGPGRLSRSATCGLAAVALNAYGPIGVDVESSVGEARLQSALALFAHSREVDELASQAGEGWATGLWTRKESVLKACGAGLAIPASSVRTGWRNGEWQAVQHDWLGGTLVCSVDARWPAISISLAVAGSKAPEVLIRTLPPAVLVALQKQKSQVL